MSEAAQQPDRGRCEDALHKLLYSGEPVVTAMLAYRDGRSFLVKSHGHPEPGNLAAMTSALAALSSTVLRELAGDESDLTLIESRTGKLVLIPVPAADRLLMLAVHAEGSANLGRLLSYARACAVQANAAFAA
jgi:predicted regulator of Ras-like GTPase activity (Roadblock/LC7/MglB family)